MLGVVFAENKFDKSNIVMKSWKGSNFSTNGGLLSISSPVGNKNNEVIGYSGFNILGLGYYSKNYHEPLKVNSWNTYWHWGTALVFIPYIGVGTEYLWENGWHFGFVLYYILPQIEFGFRF